MRIWTVLLIVFGLIVVLVAAYVMSQTTSPAEYYYSQIKDSLKTGDIVLFSSKNNGNVLQSSMYFARTRLVGSEYGHVGVVLKRNDGLFLIECCNPSHVGYEQAYNLNDKKQGGIRIIELSHALNSYYDMYGGYYAIKPIKEAIPSDKLVDCLRKYSETIFEDINFVYFVAALDVIVSRDIAKSVVTRYRPDVCFLDRMTCGEFLYRLLTDCQIVRESKAKLMWPHIYTLKKFDKLANNAYGKHYKIICDAEQQKTGLIREQ